MHWWASIGVPLSAPLTHRANGHCHLSPHSLGPQHGQWELNKLTRTRRIVIRRETKKDGERTLVSNDQMLDWTLSYSVTQEASKDRGALCEPLALQTAASHTAASRQVPGPDCSLRLYSLICHTPFHHIILDFRSPLHSIGTSWREAVESMYTLARLVVSNSYQKSLSTLRTTKRFA